MGREVFKSSGVIYQSLQNSQECKDLGFIAGAKVKELCSEQNSECILLETGQLLNNKFNIKANLVNHTVPGG